MVTLWLLRATSLLVLPLALLALVALAGADDQPRSPLAPVLGLGIAVAAVATVGAVWGGPVDPDPRTWLVVAAMPVLELVAWPVGGTRAMGRYPLRDHLQVAALLAVPAVVLVLHVAVATA